jgi:acyl-CoA thioester hydrolase
VVEAYVRYRRSVRFDELVVIETSLTELARVRVRFGYRLLRTSDTGAEEVLAEGYTVLACVGRDHIPRRLPPEAEAVLMGPEVDESLPVLPLALGAR